MNGELTRGIYLRQSGNGQPVLMLHGNPDSGRMWSGVVEHLGPDFRCLAPDLPGFGLSTAAPDFDCSLEAMVGWVDAVVDVAGIDQPLHLVVHDFGGPYGLSWAVRNPGRVLSIAASNTLFFPDYRWHFWARIWRTPGLGELSHLLMNRGLFRWELRRGSRRLTEEHLRDTWEYVTPSMKSMVLRLYRATDSNVFIGWYEELRALMARIPSLAAWGVHDPYIAPRWAHQLGARRVALVEESGHWLPAEAPAEMAEMLLELWQS